jgi:hypothetical protein
MGGWLSKTQQHTLADALKSLKQGVSRRLIGDAEHFWQKQYYDFNVRNYPQFVEKLRYIHRNPVKGGLCDRPEDWQWSSFRHYATGAEGRVEIESEWTARKRERAAGRLCPAVVPYAGRRVKAATRRLGVICSILLGRSCRNKSSEDMAFPHPQSRKDHYRKETNRVAGA